MNGNTRGVYLHVAGVGKVSSLAVALHGCGTVAAHCVGREEICVAVTAGCNNHSVGRETLKFACDEVLGDDSACTAIDYHHVFHLVACIKYHAAGLNLAAQG